MVKFQKNYSPIASVSWLVIERVLAILLNALVALAMARHLLPAGFGTLNYLMSLVYLVLPFLSLGLNSIVSRELLNRPLDKHEIMGSALALRAISALCICPSAIWLGCLFLEPLQRELFAVLMLASVFNFAHVVEFWLQAYLANRFASILRLISLFLFSIGRLLAIKLDSSLEVFVYLAALEMAFLAVMYLVLYQKLSSGLDKLRAHKLESKRLLKDSRWLFFSGVAAVIYLKIDQVMLGLIVDERAVGIYAAAARISEVWYFIPTAIVVSYFPKLMGQKGSSSIAYTLELQKINDLLLSIGVLVALLVTMVADDLVLLFGQAYSESVEVLVVHIWGGLFVFMRALLSKWLIVENLLKLSMLSQVLGALVNVILNAWLIPVYGPVGAAYATVIGHVVAGYLVLFCHRELWPMAAVVNRSIMLPARMAHKWFGISKI